MRLLLVATLLHVGCFPAPSTPSPAPVRLAPAPTSPEPTEPDSPTPPAIGSDSQWPVRGVVDGDTVDIDWMSTEPMRERLRLLCIDTPERGEPGFREATDAMAELLAGSDVKVEFDPEHAQRDRYGRLLVYLVTSDGRCVNVEMVREGWSTYWTEFGESGLYDAEFRAAEAEAKEAGRAIWSGEPNGR